MRRARINRFLSLLPPGRSVSILDVGGNEAFWERNWDPRCERITITLLNLTEEPTSGRYPIRSLVGDARDLSRFDTDEFDFCFSNSVIEHVGTLADQSRMAAEVRRVARSYFVQTPYRYFPIEPHFHVPAWQFLPAWFRASLHQRMNLGYMHAAQDFFRARMDVDQIRLLSAREFQSLFPDAEIHYEKVGPFVKSLIAIRIFSVEQDEAYDESIAGAERTSAHPLLSSC